MLREDILKELKEEWDYTTEELSSIEDKLIEYGVACLNDSSVREEIDDVEKIYGE